MGKYKSEQAILNNRSRAKKWREENPERFRASTKAWYLKNKDRVCEIERHRSRFKLYGVTKEKYETMLEEHLNKCAICGKNNEDCEKSLSIDHCHNTGKVRGLLCAGCNFLVGRIEDLGIDDIVMYFNKYNINK
jgi:hypothetical protein